MTPTEAGSTTAPGGAATVRDATLDVMRRHGLTTVFANPGSTEVPFLADLPDDVRFVLALHEASVVGAAAGWALGQAADGTRPAFVNLHTVAGLGNAVGALATARQNRVPLVVVVGEQDRRHVAEAPFLSGPLDGLAGTYPVSAVRPARPQDVPRAVARAAHDAVAGRGPALVHVPMDDWDAPADPDAVPGPAELVHATGVDEDAVGAVADRLAAAARPALVVGAGADDPVTWGALTALADRLGAPVWQEAFGARAGFPQDHPRFAGHLPAVRTALRDTLAGHDVVLAVGAPVFRQYVYADGPLLAPGTDVVQVTDDEAEAHRAPAGLAVVAALPAFASALATRVPARDVPAPQPRARPRLDAPSEGEPLHAGHVFTALADRLPEEAVVVEETPSSRPGMHAMLPARAPLGFLSAAGGGLGFALPAATGLRMARADRPVVAVVGDGSSLYAVQALWTAAKYGAGALFVVLVNGGYAIMDRLVAARDPDAKAPWPGFGEVDVTTLARSLGCPSVRVSDHLGLEAALDEVVPDLATRTEPLLLAVDVSPHPSDQP